MVFLNSLFTSSSNRGSVPSYLKNEYEKVGLNPDNDLSGEIANQGKKMYCTICRKIYNGGYMCPARHNILVEWK